MSTLWGLHMRHHGALLLLQLLVTIAWPDMFVIQSMCVDWKDGLQLDVVRDAQWGPEPSPIMPQLPTHPPLQPSTSDWGLGLYFR